MQAIGAATSAEFSRETLGVAVEAAHAAAAVIREAVKTAPSLVWEEKGLADFVTEVDRAAESAIARVIRRSFADAAIVGEELSPGIEIEQSRVSFIVDPLDGTTNFLHAYPQYAVSIGVMRGRDLIAGVVLNIPDGEKRVAAGGIVAGNAQIHRWLLETLAASSDINYLDQESR